MNKVKVGLVGVGIIGKDHANTLSRLPQVGELGIYDADSSRAEAVARQYAGHTAGSLRELVRGSDIVWLCTPPFARSEALAMACREGKPLFCEKPLATTERDLRRVETLVERSGIRFFMGQSGRYSYFFMKMKELVAAGAIGKPTKVWATRLGWLEPSSHPAWRTDDTLGGGTVIELGVHELDFIRWIGGDWDSVYASGSSLTLIPGKFQDTVSAVGMVGDGVTARLDISWASPRYLWQRGVEGTEGSLFFDDSHVQDVVLSRPGKEPEIFKTGTWQNKRTLENLSLREQAIAVLDALRNDQSPPVTLEDGAAAVRAALAIRKSVATGRVVKLK